jgi:hypothetical protein
MLSSSLRLAAMLLLLLLAPAVAGVEGAPGRGPLALLSPAPPRLFHCKLLRAEGRPLPPTLTLLLLLLLPLLLLAGPGAWRV